MKKPYLIIPDKPDPERDTLAEKWQACYGEFLKVGKFWIKPDTNGLPVALYGNDSFCLVLAQILGLEMVSPRDEMIAELNQQFTKRNITILSLAETDRLTFPIFVKPVTPKIFKAKVYSSAEDLHSVTEGIKPEEKILASEIVEITKEARAFVFNRQIMDMALYEGEDGLEDAQKLAQLFLEQADITLPETFVMDWGYSPEKGWLMIEFNSSWGAGLNFCDPEKVLPCIKAATVNPA